MVVGGPMGGRGVHALALHVTHIPFRAAASTAAASRKGTIAGTCKSSHFCQAGAALPIKAGRAFRGIAPF